MKDTTTEEVESVVFGFMQRCFIGAVPSGEAPADEAEWVRATLRNRDRLTPQEVATWPPPKQLALYELLRDILILLHLRSGTFPPGELLGSSEAELKQPLLSGLGSAPIGLLRG